MESAFFLGGSERFFWCTMFFRDGFFLGGCTFFFRDGSFGHCFLFESFFWEGTVFLGHCSFSKTKLRFGDSTGINRLQFGSGAKVGNEKNFGKEGLANIWRVTRFFPVFFSNRSVKT